MNNISRLQKGVFFALPLLTLVAAILFSGCRKDLGNYSYNRVDTLVFGNFQGSYNVQLGTSPGILPVLTFKQGTPFVDSNYTYEWVCYNNSVATASERRSTLHRLKNLDVVLGLSVGSYSCYYVVTDKSNGVTWQKAFILTVSGSIKKQGGLCSTK
ncbi:PKD-like family lipoprotein [Niabella hibiscisoli]|uniref:PKD-like family lipoprotein n=1 Tax=Niabella hibiscisoli TaxID=1825928 RepID=UPI001F0DFD60|nr:PKD-like family lipoprotein [Niabella hibiscisoli]MCH5719797.1 PKD-like family lipoprotein [Niabella hibiscisoli]